MFSTYFRCSYAGGKLRHNYTGILFRKVAYTQNNVPGFVAVIDFETKAYSLTIQTVFEYYMTT
jgi:hypothetical protein